MASLVDTHPHLADEWRGDRDISTVTAGSAYKATWACPGHGHVYIAAVNSRTRGTKCGVCSGKVILAGFNDLASKRPDIAAEWDATKNDKRPDEVAVTSRYVAHWVCAEGHEWAAPVARRSVSGCGVCANKATMVGFNDLASTNPDIAAEWDDERWQPNEIVSGSNRRVQWKCSECGHRWNARVVDRVTVGHKCPACVGRVTIPGQTDIGTTHPALAFELDDPSYQPEDLSHGSNKKVWWKCSLNHRWKATVTNRVSGAAGCPTCANRKVLVGFNDLATTHPHLVTEWSANNTLQPTEVVAGSAIAVSWVCAKGHEWSASVYSRSGAGAGCMTCARTQFSSQLEKDIAAYVASILAPDEVMVQPARGVVKGHELDIWLPRLNIAIEVNGLYWHSEANGKGKAYHKTKNDACREAGIRLIQVWEDDWKQRQPVIQQMLAQKLGVANERTVFARKTTVEHVPSSEARAFANAHHIQGAVGGTIYLGLRDKDSELVALMILTKQGSTLTLDRYCTSANVPGGHSKLVKALHDVPGWERIVTFADHEVSDGALYEQTGWTKDGELAPDYRYLYRAERVHKFNFRKKRFREDPALKYDASLTERELAALNGIPRIWDSGKTRYVYDRTQ